MFRPERPLHSSSVVGARAHMRACLFTSCVRIAVSISKLNHSRNVHGKWSRILAKGSALEHKKIASLPSDLCSHSVHSIFSIVDRPICLIYVSFRALSPGLATVHAEVRLFFGIHLPLGDIDVSSPDDLDSICKHMCHSR